MAFRKGVGVASAAGPIAIERFQMRLLYLEEESPIMSVIHH